MSVPFMKWNTDDIHEPTLAVVEFFRIAIKMFELLTFNGSRIWDFLFMLSSNE